MAFFLLPNVDECNFVGDTYCRSSGVIYVLIGNESFGGAVEVALKTQSTHAAPAKNSEQTNACMIYERGHWNAQPGML